MAARSIDTASISFGLVSIPVRVFSTSEPSRELHFHMLHATCGKRVHQQLVCPEHGVVGRDELAKGYEITRGHTLELDPKELAALDAVANDEIAIREFVPADAVDPILVEHTYYLAPNKGGARAYRLLRDALAASELVAVAAYAARGKSYVVAVRPYQTGLAMHQLRYADEIKPWSAIELGDLPAPAASELALAKTLIGQLRHAKFDPARYTDDVKARVRALLEDKAKTGEVIVTPEAAEVPARPVDLMAALRASLEAAPARAPHATHHAHAPRARPATHVRTTRSAGRGARRAKHSA